MFSTPSPAIPRDRVVCPDLKRQKSERKFHIKSNGPRNKRPHFRNGSTLSNSHVNTFMVDPFTTRKTYSECPNYSKSFLKKSHFLHLPSTFFFPFVLYSFLLPPCYMSSALNFIYIPLLSQYLTRAVQILLPLY